MILNIIIGIAAFIVLLLIIALFVKKENKIQREIIIDKPKQVIYDYIKFTKNHDHYNKWVMTDPVMKKDSIGVDGNVGFVYIWDSTDKSVGAGEQETKKLVEGERIEYEIRFIRPFAGVAFAEIKLDSLSANQTKVQWRFESSMPYPMNIMRLFINFEALLGKDLDISLGRLKSIMEGNK